MGRIEIQDEDGNVLGSFDVDRDGFLKDFKGCRQDRDECEPVTHIEAEFAVRLTPQEELAASSETDAVPMSEDARLTCPHCGCDTFRRRAEDEVRIIDEGESIRDDLLGSFEEYSYSCVSCGREVSEEELVRASPVSESAEMSSSESRRTAEGQG